MDLIFSAVRCLRFRMSVLMLVVILLSCSDDSKRSRRAKAMNQKDFIMNLHLVYSDAEDNVSFPLWFNDSLIKANSISMITRSCYSPTEDEEDSLNLTLKKRYYFDREGEVTRLEITQYYDEQQISTVSFDYDQSIDPYGMRSLKKVSGFAADDQSEHAYKRHEKAIYTPAYLVYLDEDAGNYLFYVTDKNYWGVYSVDTMLNPTPQDKVVYGTPRRPSKLFQIENKVNETNVVNYEYSNSNGPIERIIWDNHPFLYKRTFHYAKGGDFDYFIDSTFSNDTYLSRAISRFYSDVPGLPKKMIRKRSIERSDSGDFELELFDYEFGYQ